MCFLTRVISSCLLLSDFISTVIFLFGIAAIDLPNPVMESIMGCYCELPAAISEEDANVLFDAVSNAIEALMQFREKEGRKLYEFFTKKIDNIRELLTAVEPYCGTTALFRGMPQAHATLYQVAYC